MAEKFLWGSAVGAENAAASFKKFFWEKFGQSLDKFGQNMGKLN